MTWMTILQPLNEASRYTALWKPLLTCLDWHSHSLEWGLTLLCSGHLRFHEYGIWMDMRHGGGLSGISKLQDLIFVTNCRN